MAASARKKHSTAKHAPFAIGIDLGGTKIAAGLIDSHGETRNQVIKPSHPSGLTPAAREAVNREIKPKDHIRFVVEAMSTAVEELIAKAPGKTPKKRLDAIDAVGLASAGPMNVLKGRLLNPANFHGWHDVPIRELLEKSLVKRGIKKPVLFQNDAIAAALGEGWTGSAQGCETYAMITLGTGVGSGVILNGHPAQSAGMGSEWGHMILRAEGVCREIKSYERRTAEGMSSGTGLLRRARARGHTGASVVKLAEAAHAGDKLAIQVFDEAGEALACLMFNLSLGFHCQKIVIGGGLLPIRDLFLPRAIRIYNELISVKNPDFRARVVIARLGNGAGMVGAARLARFT
jgi:glucokinase